MTGLFLAGLITGMVIYAYVPHMLYTTNYEPPANLVIVSDRIHTAGQPSEAQLVGHGAPGYDLVINLVPPTAINAIAKEGSLVTQGGSRYVHIPVDWNKPRYEDFAFFSAILRHTDPQHVLVHCQVNKRASLFTFLYQVVHAGADPDVAYESVTTIWVPDPHWIAFAQRVLKHHHITFEF